MQWMQFKLCKSKKIVQIDAKKGMHDASKSEQKCSKLRAAATAMAGEKG